MSATRDDQIRPGDLGCTKVGLAIEVPAMFEVDVATLVVRDGRLSAEECSVVRNASNSIQTWHAGIVVFDPNGPLRPGTNQYLVVADGRRFQVAGGGHSPNVFGSGIPLEEERWSLAGCWCKPSGSTSTSAIVGNDCTFGVWVFVRVLPIKLGHDLHDQLSGPSSLALFRDGSVSEVLRAVYPSAVPQPSAPPAPATTVPSGVNGF